MYRRKTNITTITIDLVFFTALAPFRIASNVKRWRLTHNPTVIAIDSMSGLEFEKYIARLLNKQGYTHISLTERYDYGIDIVAEKDGIRYGIQTKRYTGLVKAEAVRQVVTALNKYKCHKAMVITNSSFSRVAQELAKSNDCLMVDRSKLAQWINR